MTEKYDQVICYVNDQVHLLLKIMELFQSMNIKVSMNIIFMFTTKTLSRTDGFILTCQMNSSKNMNIEEICEYLMDFNYPESGIPAYICEKVQYFLCIQAYSFATIFNYNNQ